MKYQPQPPKLDYTEANEKWAEFATTYHVPQRNAARKLKVGQKVLLNGQERWDIPPACFA